MMKRIAFILLAAMLLTGCVQAQSRASELINKSEECQMIGKSFAEIEDRYGPLLSVYIEADGALLFLLEKTAIGFYFGGLAIPSYWHSYTATRMIPAAVVIRDVPSTETCTGVSGRLKDYGVQDVGEMSDNLRLLEPEYSDRLEKDVYTFYLTEQDLILSALCERDQGIITKETVVRIQKGKTPGHTVAPDNLPTPAPIVPVPTPDYETPYQTAKAYMEEGKYIEALAIFKELNGYRDSEALIVRCQNEIVYQNAMDQYKGRHYKEAEILFKSLGNYRDAEIYMLRARILPSKKGDRIIFGRFEQDDKTSAPEDIEWIVLARSGNKRLLISRYILTTLPFDKNHKVADDRENIAEAGRVPAPWEKSSLRKWLNGTFYTTAFDKVEQSVIQTTRVTNEGNTGFNIKGGAATKDKIFLLSISEATKYFSKDANRKTSKTNYAKNIYSLGKRYNWWWLRSPGMHYDFAAIVMSGGGYTEDSGDWQGRGANNPGGVRPVMWIDLS